MNKQKGNFEVIVVDDASSDTTKIMIENIPSKLKYNLSYIKVKRKVGLPSARNIGIEYSNSNLIGFLDDDCLPIRNDLIDRAYRWLTLKNRNIIGVGGPVYFRSNVPYTIKPKMNIKDLLNLKNLLKTISERIDIYYFKKQNLSYSNTLPGGNCYFKKDIVELCNRFNPFYDGNYCREETDLCMKLKKYGKLITDPKMPVNHLQVNYGGCRQKTEDLYLSIFTNTILLILNHKRISIEIFMDSVRQFIRLNKMYFTGKGDYEKNINFFKILKLLIFSLYLGIKKYYSQKDYLIQNRLEEIKHFRIK